MLNRRHLRVKVLQSLYAFFQSHNQDLDSGIKELLRGIEKVYDLYLYQLMFLAELVPQEERLIEENLMKRLPAYEDLNPNRRFLENECLRMIAGDEKLGKKAKRKGIHWHDHGELIRRLIQQIRQQRYYQEYMKGEATGLEADTRFVLKMLKKDILPFEGLHFFYEEKSIYWIDDWELVNKMLIRTLKNSVDAGGRLVLMDLFKDASDKTFALDLFQITILNHAAFNGIISAKTKNWDVERIALMDMIIMEMALTEILKLPEIPVKVSLNEYIELSKMYSTPKSKVFVNGVLDKLVEEFVKEKKISLYTSGLDGGASE